MPLISKTKKEKIQEQILYYLFTIFPKQVFTVDIARELARDEEFIKKIMFELASKGLVVRINKNSKGIKYERRTRWRLSNNIHEIYLNQQNKHSEILQKIEQNL
jgi:predicted transcriptional regulator with HTH domain